jgi:hypothetical protein
MIFANSRGSAGLQCAGGPAQCTPAEKWDHDKKSANHFFTENWKAGFLEMIFHGKFFFLVSKKNDIILEKLYPASTAVRRFSEHCISWDGPQNHGKNEKLTHIEMGIWWDKSINH